jgi:2-methylaconitate cis-trans-isomerase PrpF
LNGLGAGISSLSKICIVGQGDRKRDGYDVTYEFVGIGIEKDEVDYAGNCGNMASAIGPWAMENGFVESPVKGQDNMTVTFLNTNTKRIMSATFALDTRFSPPKLLLSVEPTVPGVSGLGVPVLLSFEAPAGSKTGKLLPTGNARDTILGHQVTCVDAGNPCIFIRASDFTTIHPTILPSELLSSKNSNVLEKLDAIRRAAAVKMGMCKTEAETPRVVPKIALVSPPATQTALSGEVNEASESDLVIRFISDGQPHRAIPLTGAVCTGAAAGIEGGIVEECLKAGGATPLQKDGRIKEHNVRIAQPSGVMSVKVVWKGEDVERVGVVRSTRKIMQGEVFWVDES